MPDLKQALKDFVATSNSGKYKDDATLLSKFPELKGYDVQALKDFVATSNSGKYKTDEELFSKFPEFNQVTPEKKKVSTASPSVDGSLVSKGKTPEIKFQQPSVIPQRSTINVATNKVEPYVAPKQPKQPEESFFNLPEQFLGEAGKSVLDFGGDVVKATSELISSNKEDLNKLSNFELFMKASDQFIKQMSPPDIFAIKDVLKEEDKKNVDPKNLPSLADQYQ